MRKTPFLGMFVFMLFALGVRPSEAQVPYHGNGPTYLALLQAAYRGLERVVAVFAPFRIPLLADGGGDGGDGGGGGGDGSGGSDGSSAGDGGASGDGSSADSGGNGDGNGDGIDGVSANAAAADANAPDAQTSPTDPESIPTNDPSMSLRGGVPSGSGGDGFPQPSGSLPPDAPPAVAGRTQDIAIHAVIVSGVQSPWDAISKGPGVRNVTLTGGLVSLGKTPQSGEPVAGGPPPTFLKIIPDPKLLNGSIIPPVVPNVIDVRIVSYSVKADMPSN